MGRATLPRGPALEVELTDLFLPILPAMIAGLAMVLVMAVRLGRIERARLADGVKAGDPDLSRQP